MKRLLITLLVLCSAFSASAEALFSPYTDATLYGILDNQPGPLSYTNNGIVATFSGVGGNMNRTGDGFGIDAAGSGDTSYLIDFGEVLKLKFDQDIQITTLDFRNFENGESINVIIGTTTNTITWALLDNQTSDYIENLSWDVSEGTTVSFEMVGATDAIAFDSVTVVPEPATIAMFGIGGFIAWIIRRSSRK